MESLHSKGAKNAFSKLSQNLDEYPQIRNL